MTADAAELYGRCIRLKETLDGELEDVRPGCRLPPAKHQMLMMTEREFVDALDQYEQVVEKSSKNKAVEKRRLAQLRQEQETIRTALERQGIRDERAEAKARGKLLSGGNAEGGGGENFLGSAADAGQQDRQRLVSERQKIEVGEGSEERRRSSVGAKMEVYATYCPCESM